MHIIILESRSLVSLMRMLVLDGGDRRFSALLDSRVAKGAHAKGRTSAVALRPSLLSAPMLQLGTFNPAYGFAPTRLNTADAPTRDEALPSTSPSPFGISCHALRFLLSTLTGSEGPLQDGFSFSSL